MVSYLQYIFCWPFATPHLITPPPPEELVVEDEPVAAQVVKETTVCAICGLVRCQDCPCSACSLPQPVWGDNSGIVVNCLPNMLTHGKTLRITTRTPSGPLVHTIVVDTIQVAVPQKPAHCKSIGVFARGHDNLARFFIALDLDMLVQRRAQRVALLRNNTHAGIVTNVENAK